MHENVALFNKYTNFDMAETLLYHQGDKRRFSDSFACFQAKAKFNCRETVKSLIFTPD